MMANKRMRHSRLRDAIGDPPKRGAAAHKAKPAPRTETSYDRDHVPLHCRTCGRIYNGPHFGEIIGNNSDEYKRIDTEQEALRGPDAMGAISDTESCNKRSCIDSVAQAHYDRQRAKYPDRDWDESERQWKQDHYKRVRENADMYPEGLIDDVEPPLGGDE